MDSFTQLPAKAGRGGGDLHSFQPRQQEGAGRFHPASSQSRPGGGGFAYSPAANGKRKENAQQIPQLPAKTAGVQLQQEGGGSYNPSHSSFGNVAGDSQPIHAANVAATLAGDSQPQSQPQLIWQCSSSCGIVAAKGASL
jgi:hypothetical protein